MASESMQLDLDQLRNCFAEARDEREQLEASIERSLEHIHALQRRMCHWHIELCDSREELENERARIARQAEQASEQQSDQTGEIRRLEQELAEARDALSRRSATDEELESQGVQQQEETRRLREECEKLKQDRQEALRELEAQARTAEELRTALEATQEGITEELEKRLASINDELAQTRAQADERNEALHGLEQERASLETELEMVRTRAAELTETLDKERRQMAEDRAEWSGELKQLRRLLERQARLAANPLANADAQHMHAAPDDEPVGNGSKTPRRDDPVVGSVLAQFDRIRQQRLATRAAN